MDKSKLGSRDTCHSCGCKYYDLNRPEVSCPECGTDPSTAPKMTKKALLSGNGRKRPAKEEEEAPP
ncbi:MAG: FYDLN acid domain-containing protein, partial [Myxococcota bacterium]